MKLQFPSLIPPRLRSWIEKYPRWTVTQLWMVALISFGLCLMAYGLMLPKMGFYWDDWPWIWLSHISGAAGLLKIDHAHRPLAGVILWLSYQAAGTKPLNWQILNLIYRWLGGVSLYWMLCQLWPSHKSQGFWVTLLFLVYPAFSQQFVSVNSSRHILPAAFFFLSLGVMILSLRRTKTAFMLSLLGVGLGLVTMLSTEYYYGLELTRPILIWLALEENKKLITRAHRTFQCWLPYLMTVGLVFAWRYTISQKVNYPVTITASLVAHPLQVFINTIIQILKNGRISTYSAYGLGFDFPQSLTLGELNVRLFWLAVISTALLIALFLILDRSPSESHRWWRSALTLGGVSLLVGSLPFLVTDLGINLNFPQNRALLPMMFGSSLLVTALIDALIYPRWAKVCLVACLVGLSVGVHFRNALDFQKDWEAQRAFFWQLVWRIPALMPNTTLITTDLPTTISTDNSLTAPLNWIYAKQNNTKEIPYLMIFLRLRDELDLPRQTNGLPVITQYGSFRFAGADSNILSFYNNSPGCLKILHPKYDSKLPQLPMPLKRSLSSVNLEAIIAKPSEPTSLPYKIFGAEPQADWCYYFEKADLARQLKDWQTIKQLGESAFQFVAERKRASENTPFIQGYAYINDWQQAVELTAASLRLDPNLTPLLCALWRDIIKNTPQSPQKERAQQDLLNIIDCQGE